MKIAKDWIDFKVIATGNGEKLERWGDVVLLRPDPQVIWEPLQVLDKFKGLNAKYSRSLEGGGQWETYQQFPQEWQIAYKDLKFLIKPMGFKHTGLFPEQAYNWDRMREIVKKRKLKNKATQVLNLFAYTGGATVALAKEGANVTHVDAAKSMVDRAKQNCAVSSIATDKVRYIVDDCKKFVMREIKRGKKYDAIIMDPPSYGRGPNGEMWKIEDSIYDLVNLTKSIISDDFSFYLINSYTTGLQAGVIGNILSRLLKEFGGNVETYELGLPTSESDIVLPCGNSGIFEKI